MVSEQLLNDVASLVDQHIRGSKGFEEESFLNPLTPTDCVAAFGMAQALAQARKFDHLVAVAPEGHVYGYFFQRLGNPVLSVHVDYPPRRCEILDDLEVLRGKRVLILEDDVASGTTLRLVIGALQAYMPASIDLYLGRPKNCQILESIDPTIGSVYLAEDFLDPDRRNAYESQFISFFCEE